MFVSFSPSSPAPSFLLQDAKVMDQTRGILTHITQTCPGRHHAEVEYVTGKLPVSMAQASDTLKNLQ